MLMLSLVVPVVILLAILSKYYISYKISEFNQIFALSAYKSKSDFDLIANNCDNLYTTEINNANTLKFLNQSSPEPTSIESYILFTDVLQRYQSFIIANPHIDSVSLYCTGSDYILSTNASGYRENFYQKNIVDKLINNQKCRTFVSSTTDTDGKRKNIITLAYDLCVNSYNEPDGILIVNIDCNSLARVISSKYTHESILLFSQDGDALNSHPNFSAEEIDKISNLCRKNKEQIKQSYFLTKAQHSVLCYIPVEQLNIIMALCVNSSSYDDKVLIPTTVTLLAIVFLTLIVILAVSLYTSLNIYSNIANIVSSIGISPIMQTNDKNEISFISNNFLSILKNSSDIEKELSDKILMLQKSQMLALQTQINPHFIFNTLNLVNLMIMRITQENCAPAKIITLLSDILYYSLKTSGFITTVDEELSYTQKYIQIEQIKYDNKFSVEIDVSENLKKCKTIKFMLQPIIENCIEHGIKRRNDNSGFIKLKIYKENNFLKFSISDNGTGIPNDKLQEINQKLKSTDVPIGKHIGLANVNQRIQLLFGDEYGVKIIPLDKGTKIEITLPIKS